MGEKRRENYGSSSHGSFSFSSTWYFSIDNLPTMVYRCLASPFAAFGTGVDMMLGENKVVNEVVNEE